MGKSGKRRGYRPRSAAALAAEKRTEEAAQARQARQRVAVRRLLILLAVLLCLGALWGVFALISRQTGWRLRHTAVIEAPHCRLDGAMLSYYFYEYTAAALREGGEGYVGEEGLDPARPLREQVRNAATGETWEDYFMAELRPLLLRMTVFVESAHRAGDIAAREAAAEPAVEERLSAIYTAAEEKGQESASYIEGRYGKGVGEQDLRRAILFAEVARARQEELLARTYTAEERAALYAEEPDAFRMASYLRYQVKVDLDGLTDEAAVRGAYAAAEARARAVAAATDEASFLAAVRADLAAMHPSWSQQELARAGERARHDEIPFPGDGSTAENWLFRAERRAGDIAMLGETGDYTVVLCLAPPARLDGHRADARLLYLPYDEFAGKGSALAAAEEILAVYQDGAGGESAFAALVHEHSLGAGRESGGWMAGVRPDDVERAVFSWLSEPRTAGEVGVVEGIDGCYLLYYVGASPYTIWEERAMEILREREYDTLQAAAALRVQEGAFSIIPALTPRALGMSASIG